MIFAALLTFAICGGSPSEYDDCEQGELRARSCVIAETYLRAGLRVGQVLHVHSCTVQPMVGAAR